MNQIAALTRLDTLATQLEQTGHARRLAHLARAVLKTNDAESDCDAYQSILAEYVETELNGRSVANYHALRRHLDLGPACEAMYLELIRIALLAEQDALPSPELTIDLAFLPPGQ